MRIAPLFGLIFVAFAALLAAGAGVAHGHTTVTIYVGDFWFCGGTTSCPQPYPINIGAGDRITWQDLKTPLESIHTVTQCGATCFGPPPASPVFDSRTDPSDDDDSPPYDRYLEGGDTYTFTFDTPGTYRYRCELHPFMFGMITVSQPEPAPTQAPPPAQEQPSATQPSPTPTEAAAGTPSPTPVLGVARVPSAGGPAPDRAGVPPDWVPVVAGLLLLAGGALVLRPRSPRG